jgi:hypothetical protein
MTGSEPAGAPEQEPADEPTVEDTVVPTSPEEPAAPDAPTIVAPPAGGWAAPSGAPPADPATPTVAVPIAQRQPEPQPHPQAQPQDQPPPAYASQQYPQYQYPYPAAGQSGQPAQPGAPTVYPAGYGQAYQPPYPYPPSPEQVQAALARKRSRKRILWTVTSVVVVAALATVGIVALNSGRHGDSVVTAVPCAPAKLSSCLIKQPAGAVPLSDAESWDKALTPSVDAFATYATGDAKGLGGQTAAVLSGDGETAVAHTDWNAVDGDDIDMVLLKFSSTKGARSWNTLRNAEILAAYPGQSAAVPGDSAEQAHAAAAADSAGNYRAAYSAVVGDIVVNVAYSSPNTFAPADLRGWAGTELASLRSAPAPAADRPETAPGTEQAACPDLHACLPSMPSGTQHWDSPNNSGWVGSATLSAKQYVNVVWDAKAQSSVLADFTNDAVVGIAHTDWMTSDAYQQADVYLVQTLVQGGASALYSDIDQQPNWGGGLKGTAFAVPGVTGVDAWHTTTADSGGLVDGAFAAQVGNVIIDGYVNFYGSFDTALADRWIADAVKKVQATESEQPLGLPSLAAPAVHVPAQGSCPASGDCRIPLPAGAKDTTGSSSYATSATVTADGYANTFDGSLSASYTTWLGSDGFQSAEHRAWTAGDGTTADAVLLKFGSAAQAQASAMAEYGAGAQLDRECTVRTVANALCLAEPVSPTDFHQMETVDVLAWKGEFEVRVQVTSSDRADLADAYAWAEQQLAMLPAG